MLQMRVILKVRNLYIFAFFCKKLPVLRLFADANGKVQKKSLSNTCILSTLYGCFSWIKKKLNDIFPQLNTSFVSLLLGKIPHKSWAHVLEFDFVLFLKFCFVSQVEMFKDSIV